MIIGIGIDIVELDRIKRLMERQDSFAKRILTALEEREWQALSKQRQVEYLAGRFAAKEAIGKALGTGIGQTFGWQDVSILQSPSGAPLVQWGEEKKFITHVSISHSREYACAQAILEERSRCSCDDA